ncbi:hypothetical protein OAN21_02610 [Alphaproteobacteria bacterium]|nr:hypothetical protein [Alphaproteobacteria bacterium]
MMQIFLVIAAVFLALVFPTESKVRMEAAVPKRTMKVRSKTWQIQVSTKTKRPLIYLVQGRPPQIRIFSTHTKYHHPISLEKFGMRKITDVGLAESLKGRGQVLYLGDRTARRIFYIVLGTKDIREHPLESGSFAYKEFIEQLHPVAESERHF